jgi:phosphotriesterase-related protein
MLAPRALFRSRQEARMGAPDDIYCKTTSGCRHSNSIMTVTGPIQATDSGVTLPHEHLFIDLVPLGGLRTPPNGRQLPQSHGRWSEPLRMSNLYLARRDPYAFRASLQLKSMSDAHTALIEFAEVGGSTVVDQTPIGLGREPGKLRTLSMMTGVNIVMGTGFYIDDYHPDWVRDQSVTQLADRMIAEFITGIGLAAIRPGIIGEIGLSWPITPGEERVLRAAAVAQATTGLPLSIHPGMDPHAPIEVLRIVDEAGGDVARTAICHLERTISAHSKFLELAETGCFLSFDLFGWERSHHPAAPIDMPNDARRVDIIVQLLEHGVANQLLISHDIDSPTRLRSYGGEGLQHILETVVPLMERKGVPDGTLRDLLVNNPRDFLCVADTAVSRDATTLGRHNPIATVVSGIGTMNPT